METSEIKDLIESTNGKIFSAVFIKKNGEERTMVCRLDVKKHLKGGKLSFDPDKKNLIGVFDMKNGYRFINIDTIKSLTINKQTYEF